MEQVATPSSVHEGILAEVERVRREERRRGTPHVRCARTVSPRLQRRWTSVAASVCACALVAAVALTPLGETLFRPMGGGSTGSAATSFSVRAYASDTRTLVPPGADGMIVFDRSGALGTDDKESYLKYGKFTGCMFTVEGDDVVRIQATTSKGMLYRTSHETVNGRDNPEQVAELELWKPSKVGLGEHYGLYEDVRIIDGFGLPDPDREITVRLTKLLGSTIDLPVDADDDGDAKSFGLWTNEDYGEVDENDPMATIDAVFDLFEGETITVTAYFENGSCATQTIELHTADFKATADGPGILNGYGTITVHPEIVDPSTLPNAYGERVSQGMPFALHSLYGVIVDENDGSHPFPLDNANEWIDKTVSYTFERRETWESAGDATIDVNAISEPGGAATFRVPANTSTYTQETETVPLEVSNLRLERSDVLPFGLALEDTFEYGGFRGDLAYANKVSEETLGYRIEDDGSLTSGFSYRTVTFEVANASDVEINLHTAAAFGSFAALDDAEGHFSILGTSALWETGYDGATNSGGGCTLAPGEARELTVVYVVPDELDQQNDPLFVLSMWPGETAAFRIKPLL